MGGTVRMSEKEAIERGILSPIDKTTHPFDNDKVVYTPTGNKYVPVPKSAQSAESPMDIPAAKLALYVSVAFLVGYAVGMLAMGIIWLMNR